MIIEIKGDNGKVAKFTNTVQPSPTGEDELVLIIKKDGYTLASIVLPMYTLLKGLAEIIQDENTLHDQG